jgi:biotin carboxyl carrier protein
MTMLKKDVAKVDDDKKPGRILRVIKSPAGTQTSEFESFGTLSPERAIEVISEVQGIVQSLHPAFRDISVPVNTGEVLLKINPVDYQLAFDVAENQVNSDKAGLDQLKAELENQKKLLTISEETLKITETDAKRFEKMYRENTVSQQEYDNARMKYQQQKASTQGILNQVLLLPVQIQRAQATLQKSKAALAQSARSLEKSVLRAPFDGYLTNTNIEAGQWIGTGQSLARLETRSLYALNLSLPSNQMGFIANLGHNLPVDSVKLYCQMPHDTKMFSPHAVQVGQYLNADFKTLPIRVLVASNSSPCAASGSFLKAVISGESLEQVHRIPRMGVHNNKVQIVKDHKIKTVPAEIIRYEKESALIKHIPEVEFFSFIFNEEILDGEKVEMEKVDF